MSLRSMERRELDNSMEERSWCYSSPKYDYIHTLINSIIAPVRTALLVAMETEVHYN
jgi:hypothetical protein